MYTNRALFLTKLRYFFFKKSDHFFLFSKRASSDLPLIQKQRQEVFHKKTVFLKILQDSQENTRARVSFLTKLQSQTFTLTQKETLT